MFRTWSLLKVVEMKSWISMSHIILFWERKFWKLCYPWKSFKIYQTSGFEISTFSYARNFSWNWIFLSFCKSSTKWKTFHSNTAKILKTQTNDIYGTLYHHKLQHFILHTCRNLKFLAPGSVLAPNNPDTMKWTMSGDLVNE